MGSKQFWITVIAMLVSAAIGYYANVYANRANNALLVQLIKDQLGCVQNQIQTSQGRVSQTELDVLNNKRQYLEQQLTIHS